MSNRDFELSSLVSKAVQNRRSHGDQTYVVDIIAALLVGGTGGVQRSEALRTIERSRRESGLKVPRKFEKAVQGEFNRHCGSSAVFKRSGRPGDDLFESRHDDQNTAFWSVDVERAMFWLAERIPQLRLPR